MRYSHVLMSLSSLNINQLVALDMLLQERAVGKAARRMGISQSALSHTLKSLRELIGDPLLVRVGNSMVLTPYAERARDLLQRGLSDLETVVLGHAGFDAAESTRQFTLAAHDGTAAMLASSIHGELERRAPRARLRLQVIDEDTMHQNLARGDIDLAVVPPFFAVDGLLTEDTPATSFSLVCREDHPTIRRKPTIAQYSRVPHAMLSLSGEGPSMIDHILAEQGREREIMVRVPYLLSLAEIIASSDCIATVPTGIAEFFCQLWPIASFPLPFAIDAGGLLLCWHPRLDAEPAHQFFREVVRAALREVIEGGTPRFKRLPR